MTGATAGVAATPLKEHREQVARAGLAVERRANGDAAVCESGGRLRVAAVNYHDIFGGAARAAFRLCEGLRRSGVDLTLHVQAKTSDAFWARRSGGRARLRSMVDVIPLYRYRRRTGSYWSLNWLPNPSFPSFSGTDIVHLHFVGSGYLPISRFRRLEAPIVWTLHDMWAFTGGCHYDEFCGRYVEGCGKCPQLGSRSARDLSSYLYRRKTDSWRNLPLTVVSPSRWLADEARRSAVFREHRIEVIPNGIDLELYRPVNKAWAREILRLPPDGKLVMFGALSSTSDTRKGFAHLQGALDRLRSAQRAQPVSLVIFGAREPQRPPDLGFPVHYMGHVSDDITLALLYSASDVMVVPSVQENLSNVIVESMACGTPVVAFDIGGNRDMIEHQAGGYLAQPYAAEDLAAGIEWVLADDERLRRLSMNARRKCEDDFEISKVAARYISLYGSLLKR